MSGGRGRVHARLEAARLDLIAAAEQRRQDFAAWRANGASVPLAARLVGISERTGWRYARELRERAQAGR